MQPQFPKRQSGITLIETLVALVVTALGILGILGLQMRTMADAQGAARQAQAIRMIENLSERVRMNPNSISDAVAQAYTIDWGNLTGDLPNDCSTACSPEQQAQADVQQWKRALQGRVDTTPPESGMLPLADAKVFFVSGEAGATGGNRRQLGVMVSWSESHSAESAGDNNHERYFHLTSTDAEGNTVQCPTGRSCYLQFIQLAARCVINRSGGPTELRYYCADGSAHTIPAAP